MWNPAFDVTPAELIAAFFTERGVITRPAGSPEFNIRAFIDTHSPLLDPSAGH